MGGFDLNVIGSVVKSADGVHDLDIKSDHVMGLNVAGCRLLIHPKTIFIQFNRLKVWKSVLLTRCVHVVMHIKIDYSRSLSALHRVLPKQDPRIYQPTLDNHPCAHPVVVNAVPQRKKIIEKKQRTDQRTVKALRTVFKHHPEVFDNEPAELHSDADVEEDTMFTDRNVHSKLSFSTGKIPPTLTPVSRNTSSARKSLSNSLVKGYKCSSSSSTAVSSGEVSMSDGSPTHPGHHPTFHNSEDEWADDPDADEDDLEDSDSDGDSIGECEPVVLGTKRPSISKTQMGDSGFTGRSPHVQPSHTGTALHNPVALYDAV
ncbi:hypothetical protein EV424DRAFT_1352723 [Suillus variegatus]|nr:hypothetical protein EV424DRAFT_1352723 [Suillus variegatus]